MITIPLRPDLFNKFRIALTAYAAVTFLSGSPTSGYLYPVVTAVNAIYYTPYVLLYWIQDYAKSKAFGFKDFKLDQDEVIKAEGITVELKVGRNKYLRQIIVTNDEEEARYQEAARDYETIQKDPTPPSSHSTDL